jgi:hypothetical protein
MANMPNKKRKKSGVDADQSDNDLEMEPDTGKKKTQEQLDSMWDTVWQSPMKKMPEFRENDFSPADLQRMKQVLSNWSNPPSKVSNKQPWRTIRQQVSENETWFNSNTAKGTHTVINRVDWLLSLWLFRLENITKSGKPEEWLNKVPAPLAKAIGVDYTQPNGSRIYDEKYDIQDILFSDPRAMSKDTVEDRLAAKKWSKSGSGWMSPDREWLAVYMEETWVVSGVDMDMDMEHDQDNSYTVLQSQPEGQGNNDMTKLVDERLEKAMKEDVPGLLQPMVKEAVATYVKNNLQPMVDAAVATYVKNNLQQLVDSKFDEFKRKVDSNLAAMKEQLEKRILAHDEKVKKRCSTANTDFMANMGEVLIAQSREMAKKREEKIKEEEDIDG